MSIFAGQLCKLRCPKCRSSSYELAETIPEDVIYTVVNGVMPDEATDHRPGDPVALHASCMNCDHHWKPRGVSLQDVVIEEVDAAVAA